MPSGAALFGNSSSRSQSKNLVEFKAGKMNMKGKMVIPDKRKGLVYVYQSDDSLMHFCWKDRQTGSVEDDLIIFPDDCEFKRVNQCTSGRVYVLKFKSSSRRFFFWVQEPKTDKDEENCRRVNEVLNNPPTPGSNRSGGVTPADGELQNLLNNMSQQQLMQLFGGVGNIGGLSSLLGTMSRPSTGQSTRSSGTAAATTTSSASSTTTTAASTTATTTSGPTATSTSGSSGSKAGNQGGSIQLSDLQSFLSGLSVPPPESQQNQRPVDLSTALTTENLQSLLGDPALVEELQQHLPSIDADGVSATPPSEQLRSTLASPQFQQALSMFSAALQSGQLGPVVKQFEVSAEAVTAANQGNMEEFVKALQSTTIKDDEKKGKKDSSEKKDNNDDEGMSMD